MTTKTPIDPVSNSSPPATDGTDAGTTRANAILDACKTVFSEKGFDGASMQDLAKSADMSAGNFYRYFANKDAIITALVEREINLVETVFTEILNAPDPRRAFMTALEYRLKDMAEPTEAALWSNIEATSFRNPSIGAEMARMKTTFHTMQAQLFAQLSGLTVDEAAKRFQTKAAFIMLLVRGSTMICSRMNNPCLPTHLPDGAAAFDADALHKMILTTIDGLLAEVAATHDRT